MRKGFVRIKGFFWWDYFGYFLLFHAVSTRPKTISSVWDHIIQEIWTLGDVPAIKFFLVAAMYIPDKIFRLKISNLIIKTQFFWLILPIVQTDYLVIYKFFHYFCLHWHICSRMAYGILGGSSSILIFIIKRKTISMVTKEQIFWRDLLLLCCVGV